MNKEEIREATFAMFGGQCAFPDCPLPEEPVNDQHHAMVHNSKYHKSRHPLLLKSLFNFLPGHHSCHMAHPHFGMISDLQADYYEKFLRELKEGK